MAFEKSEGSEVKELEMNGVRTHLLLLNFRLPLLFHYPFPRLNRTEFDFAETRVSDFEIGPFETLKIFFEPNDLGFDPIEVHFFASPPTLFPF